MTSRTQGPRNKGGTEPASSSPPGRCLLRRRGSSLIRLPERGQGDLMHQCPRESPPERCPWCGFKGATPEGTRRHIALETEARERIKGYVAELEEEPWGTPGQKLALVLYGAEIEVEQDKGGSER